MPMISGKRPRATHASGSLILAVLVGALLVDAPVYAGGMGGESIGCVKSWRSLENDQGALRVLRVKPAWSSSPGMDYWGYAEPGDRPSTECIQYWYQETLNTAGKDLLISGFWGALKEPQLGPLQSQLDEAQCAHALVTYYVWGSTDLGQSYVYVGGGGKSGRWNAGRCDMDTKGDPNYPDFDVTWGTDIVYLPDSPFDEIVVGVQAITHGWGDCGEFQCYNPVHAAVAIKDH